MQILASQTQDHEANALLKKIATVPEQVKLKYFKDYVLKCCKLHRIAFYQWRILFPSLVRHDKKEITEMVVSECNRLKELKAWNKQLQNERAEVPYGFIRKYGIHKTNKPYQINNFKAIGWLDPTSNGCLQASR